MCCHHHCARKETRDMKTEGLSMAGTHTTLPIHLELELSRLGIRIPTKDHGSASDASLRIGGPTLNWKGNYYPDGEIPF